MLNRADSTTVIENKSNELKMNMQRRVIYGTDKHVKDGGSNAVEIGHIKTSSNFQGLILACYIEKQTQDV